MRSSLTNLQLLLALGMLAGTHALSQNVDVQARVEKAGELKPARHSSGSVVIWLTPEPGAMKASSVSVIPGRFRMEQKNKSFDPHLLVVPLGSMVEFPNLDPFFHNVFSQFNGKRFDLGLYEAGSSRGVRFNHEGVSYIFCNIHSQMAAVIVTLATPYYSVATGSGTVDLHDVPAGDYELRVWAEGVDAKQLDTITRKVHISPSQTDLGTIKVAASGTQPSHKNKFGEEYKPEPPPAY